MSKALFEKYKQKHPDWSDDQIWTAVSLNMEADNVIERKGKDVDPNDPDIIKSILDGAREWLAEVLPVVFSKVEAFFTNLLNSFAKWVSEGLPYIMKQISRLFR